MVAEADTAEQQGISHAPEENIVMPRDDLHPESLVAIADFHHITGTQSTDVGKRRNFERVGGIPSPSLARRPVGLASSSSDLMSAGDDCAGEHVHDRASSFWRRLCQDL